LENLLENEELVKRFLLGNVSEPERAQIEDRFLEKDDSYQELLIVEDDLIDAYVRGQLPATERALFEQRYLIYPSRRERVEFARTLFDSVSGKAAAVVPAREPDRSHSWWRSLFGGLLNGRPALGFIMAAALLVVVLGGLWLLMERVRTRPVPEEAQINPPTSAPPSESPSPQIAQAEQPPSKPEKDASHTPTRETPERTVPVVATFTLLPGMVRGESGTQLTLPAKATEVRLLLGMDGQTYKKYRATLATPEGRKVWSREVADKPSMKSANITLSLPANLLKDGDYVLEISGENAGGKWESIADYAFRVVKK
jgi:hypothetical protein